MIGSGGRREENPFRTRAAAGDVTAEQADGATVLRVAGGLDVALAPRLERTIDRAVRDGARRVVIDLTRCDFLASAGIATLARAQRRARGGDVALRIVAASRLVLRPLELTKLDGDLDIRPTLPAALADP
jgi:anti-anti-sigma factor